MLLILGRYALNITRQLIINVVYTVPCVSSRQYIKRAPTQTCRRMRYTYNERQWRERYNFILTLKGPENIYKAILLRLNDTHFKNNSQGRVQMITKV